MVVIIAIAGLVIDLGNVERVRAQMQNAADAAATAGASTLLDFQSNVAVAEDTARRYGMAADGRQPDHRGGYQHRLAGGQRRVQHRVLRLWQRHSEYRRGA